jgi:hypothetical protein
MPGACCCSAGTGAAASDVSLHDALLVEFALTLLHGGLKRGSLGGRTPTALSLLDPMLPLLVRALGSRSAACVSLALRTLALLVQLPLPGEPPPSPSLGVLPAVLQAVSQSASLRMYAGACGAAYAARRGFCHCLGTCLPWFCHVFVPLRGLITLLVPTHCAVLGPAFRDLVIG